MEINKLKITEIINKIEYRHDEVILPWSFNRCNIGFIQTPLDKERREPIINFIEKIKDPKIINGNHTPTYNNYRDHIYLPKKEYFDNEYDYYHILFHELIHSTRYYNRRKIRSSYKTTSEAKAHCFEEAITEIGALLLCDIFKICEIFDQGIHYINRWLTIKYHGITLIRKPEITQETLYRMSEEAISRVDYLLETYV